MNIFGAFSGQGATQQKFSQSFVEGAPSWAQLEEMVKGTATGSRLIEEKQQRMRGEGPTHRENKLRLFGHDEKEIRVVLYRDSAAWCPYCQKVWLLLEEKKIPYKIELINMRSYGDKPDWFLAKNPRVCHKRLHLPLSLCLCLPSPALFVPRDMPWLLLLSVHVGVAPPVGSP